MALLSVAVVWMYMAVATGIKEIPSDTMDSQGRTMGFNDPLSFEHYRIILREWHLYYFWHLEFYDLLLLSMCALGTALVVSGKSAGRKLRYFFLGQFAVFLPGALVLPFFVPAFVWDAISGTLDRESFTDLPFASLPIQWVWVYASLAVFFGAKGREKGWFGTGVEAVEDAPVN